MSFLSFICVLIGFCLLLAIYCFYFQPKNQFKKVPEPEQIRVRILNKRMLELEVNRETLDQELLQYWVYVQPLRGGAKREFEISADNYHALNPGDRGTMKYLGMQFIDFTKS